jgi:hypothetical protein
MPLPKSQKPDGLVEYLVRGTKHNDNRTTDIEKDNHYGPWIDPDLLNDWGPANPPRRTVQYRYNYKAGKLEFRGHVDASNAVSNTTVFTVDDAYIPNITVDTVTHILIGQVYTEAHVIVHAVTGNVVIQWRPPLTGLLIRGPYNITHADDLGAGVALFAVAVGDVLYDAFSVVRTAFNGTSAQRRLRIYVGSTLWENKSYPVNIDPSVTQVNVAYVDDFTGSLSLGGAATSESQQYLQGIANSSYYARTAAVVLTAGNVIVKSTAGYNPTVGDADIYVLAGTPVA